MTYPQDPHGQGGHGGQQWPGTPAGGWPQQQPQQQPYGQQTPAGGWQQQGQQGYPQTQQFGQQTPAGGWQQQGQPQQQYGQQQQGWGQQPGQQQGQQFMGSYGQQGQPQYGPIPPQQRKRGNGVLVGSLVAVIALVAAGIGTYFFAFRGADAGAASPRDAAISLISNLSNNDAVGLFDGLAPAESSVIKDHMQETMEQLKRLDVLKDDAKADQITGVSFTTENLVFDEAAEEKVNERLTITKLTGGKITVSSDWSQVPLTESFLEKAFPNGVPENETETVDIAEEIAKNDNEPIRIATVNVDGEWYPSLFYTIADYALQDEGRSWPTSPIEAKGAGSPEAAVREMADAALRADVQRVIELTPPDEMAALHDVGQYVVEAAGGEDPTGVEITDLQTRTEDVTGGKRVVLQKIALESDGETISIEINGDCVRMEQNGDGEELCGADLSNMIAQFAELDGVDLSDAQLQAIERVALGFMKSGIVTTEVDGSWYVSPSRSVADLSLGFLRELEAGDLEVLLELGG